MDVHWQMNKGRIYLFQLCNVIYLFQKCNILLHLKTAQNTQTAKAYAACFKSWKNNWNMREALRCGKKNVAESKLYKQNFHVNKKKVMEISFYRVL